MVVSQARMNGYEALASTSEPTINTGVPHTLSGLSQTSLISVQSRVPPGSNGSNLKLHGKQVRAEQIGRTPRRWPVFGVTVLHDLIHRGEIKEPELFHDIPGGGVEGRISVRIVFTKLRQDTILIGGMAAGVKWFHDVHLQSRAICFLVSAR